MKKYLIIAAFSFFIGVGVAITLSYYTGVFFKTKETIVIKEIGKPVIKYIKVLQPTDTDDLYKCYMSPIAIQYKMSGDTMRIAAADSCKRTEQNIKLEIGTSGNWKVYAGIATGALVIGGVVGAISRTR